MRKVAVAYGHTEAADRDPTAHGASHAVLGLKKAKTELRLGRRARKMLGILS